PRRHPWPGPCGLLVPVLSRQLPGYCSPREARNDPFSLLLRPRALIPSVRREFWPKIVPRHSTEHPARGQGDKAVYIFGKGAPAFDAEILCRGAPEHDFDLAKQGAGTFADRKARNVQV